METQLFPTHTVELPSKGLLYPESSPLSKGTIELKIPTGKEENILSTPALIKNNTVIDKFLESLIVDKTVKLNDIIIGDINALIYESRKLAYGASYEIKSKCPICGTIENRTIDLNLIKPLDIDESVLNRENRFEYKFEMANINITHKLMTHGDELFVAKELKNLQKFQKLTNSKLSKELTMRLASIIVSIDGEDLPDDKRAKLYKVEKILSENIPSLDLKKFRKHLKKIQPDLDTTFEYECNNCGYNTDKMEVTLDVNFFWDSE